MLLEDLDSAWPYVAPLVPAFLVGYAFRTWAALGFVLVPLAVAIMVGHPAGLDRETGTEWLFPEWFAYAFLTPFILMSIAGGVGLRRSVDGHRDGEPSSAG
jgi:hypothetical protein